MAAIVQPHNLDGSGLLLYTGLNPRPRDPREDKYRLALVPDLDWRSIDLGQGYSRVYTDPNGNLWDPRSAPGWQGYKGSCAAKATCKVAESLSWERDGSQPTDLSESDLYCRDRKRENGASWQQDTGSTLGDNGDFALTGLASVADAPDSDDLTRDYDAQPGAQARRWDYCLAHLPAYPNEDQSDPDYFIKVICAALRARRGIVAGSFWPDSSFYPDGNGWIPVATNFTGAGGHAWEIYEWRPDIQSFLCSNQWNPPGGQPWNPQVTRLGGHARPGDFAMGAWAFRGGQPLVFEARAFTWEPVAPQPQPQPSPQPSPAATCRSAALALAMPVVHRYGQMQQLSPRSTHARYGLEGAQAVADALAEIPE